MRLLVTRGRRPREVKVPLTRSQEGEKERERERTLDSVTCDCNSTETSSENSLTAHQLMDWEGPRQGMVVV